MRLRHLEAFHAVMLTGTVSGAARLLSVSQPVVTRVLQHAEAQMGMTLFRRVRGKLVPTDEARALFPQVSRLYGELEELRQFAANLRLGATHPLRLALVPALTYVALPRALIRFRARFPRVQIEVNPQHSAQVLMAVARRSADLGFVFDTAVHPALVEEPIVSSPMLAVAPRGLLGARGSRPGSVTLTQLAAHPLIQLEVSDPLGALVRAAMSNAQLTGSAGITVKTYFAALTMVAHGLGVAVIDPITAVSADCGKVDVITLDPEIEVLVKCVRAAEGRSCAHLDYLIDCMRHTLSAMLGWQAPPPRCDASTGAPI